MGLGRMGCWSNLELECWDVGTEGGGNGNLTIGAPTLSDLHVLREHI